MDATRRSAQGKYCVVVGAALALLWLASRAYWSLLPDGDSAFVLLVDATFKSVEDRDSALRVWKPVADYCRRREPTTLTYEAAISDSNELRIVFVERYTSRDAYATIHKSSAPFLAFRQQLAELTPEISGHSYVTTNLGFFR